MNTIRKVCAPGHAWRNGGSDTFHVTADGVRTFCNRDCSEWLRMGEAEDHDFISAYFCKRCHAASVKETAA